MKYIFLCLFIFLGIGSYSQLTITDIRVNSKINHPRISWSLNLYYHDFIQEIDSGCYLQPIYALWSSNKVFLSAGCELQNKGVFFDDSSMFHKISSISLSPVVALTKQFYDYKKHNNYSTNIKFGDALFTYVRVGGGVSFNFYNKDKVYGSGFGSSKRVVVENKRVFFADKNFTPDPFLRLTFGYKRFYEFYSEYHFNGFIKTNYPISKVHFGIKINVGLYVINSITDFLLSNSTGLTN